MSTSTYKNISSLYWFTDINSYGGNQEWHRGTSTNYIANWGCGAVAASNVLAFHAKYYNRTPLYPAITNNTKNAFFWHQAWIYDHYIDGPCVLPDMKDALVKFANGKGYNYGSATLNCYSSSSQAAMEKMIVSVLNGNNPVVMLMGPQWLPGDYSDFYPGFTNHWVTITGYKYINGNLHINVSSWGKKYSDIAVYKLIRSKTFIDLAYFWNR